MRAVILTVAVFSFLMLPSHAGIDTLSDLAHIAAFVARVEIVRVITLSTGEQQANAKIEEQITGKPLGSEIFIWNGDVATLPGIDKGRSGQTLHAGKYLVFLERRGPYDYTPCINSSVGFAEIRGEMVHWRGAELRLTNVLQTLPRTGIGPK